MPRSRDSSSSTSYPRPRFPNVPNSDRSLRTCAAVVPLRPASSSLDTVDTPASRSSTSRRRYSDRRPIVGPDTFFMTGCWRCEEFVNPFTNKVPWHPKPVKV